MIRLLLILMALTPLPAFAYVGPGLGLGALGVILGLLLSVLLALVAILWYPIKRMFRGKSPDPAQNPQQRDATPEHGSPDADAESH